MRPADARAIVQRDGQRETEGDAPSGQLPPVDPELFERAKAAVAAIRGNARRQARGRVGLGNTLAMGPGLRSQQLMEQPDIRAWHLEETESITNDLGGPLELGALKRRATREAARVGLILDALGDGLLEDGPLTGKGKCRSATMVYLQVLDRYLKLATMLGLERKQRQVLPSTLSEAAAAMRQERQP